MRPDNYADYIKRARDIEADETILPLRLAVLSSFTADFLKPLVTVESFDRGCPLRPWFAPFGQFEQQILQENSALWATGPDVLWLMMRVEDADPSLVFEFPALGAADARERLTSIRERLVSLAASARQRFNGPIFVSNLSLSHHSSTDPFDMANPDGLQHMLAEANLELARGLKSTAAAYVFDYAGAMAVTGQADWLDLRLWHVARIAMGRAAQLDLSSKFVRAVCAVVRPRAKCIVLDLDNTLWGGIIGDDGPGGIRLGGNYPGSAFREFQEALKWYQRRGFLLAIASKNSQEVVLDVLDTHPEMALRKQDFSAIEVNWEPKHRSLVRIAEKLNIGLDSLVFLDDNPLEREEIRLSLPMVEVIDLPSDPMHYTRCLQGIYSLDRPHLNREDAQRNEMYKAEARRKELSSQFESLEDFLEGLQMEAQVGEADTFTMERIHQLIHKTNQFNLTSRRHDLATVQELAARDDSAVAWLRLTDKLGDSGLVCVGIIVPNDPDTWEIDTFLMSCRVMGRGVEDAFLAYLAGIAIDRGAKRLVGVYTSTPKSKPVENFYDQHGFTETNHTDDTKYYLIDLEKKAPAWPEHIKLLSDGAEKE